MCSPRGLFFVVLFLVCSFQLNAETFYVRPPSGEYGLEDGSSYNNAFDGFDNIVWGTGAGEVGPGDTLYVCGSDNNGAAPFKKYLKPPISGTSLNYITISACKTSYGASTEDPGVIDCGLELDGWISGGNGVYYISLASLPYFLMEDSKPLKYASSSACSDGNWYYTNGVLYYRPVSGIPGDHIVEKPNYYSGICLDDRSYIVVKGLTIKKCFVGIRNIATPSTGSRSEYIHIEDCYITICRDGYFSSADNDETNNCIFVEDNTFRYCSRSIALYSTSDTGVEHQNCLINSNQISLPGFPFTGAAYDWSAAVPQGHHDQEAIGLQNVVNCTIENNFVTNGPASGVVLYVEQGSRVIDNVVQYNQIQCDISGINIGGHWNGDEISGNYVIYNRLKYCGSSTNNQAAVELGNRYNASQGWNYCYNNTIFACYNGIILTGHGNYWKIKNNIIQSSTQYHIWAKGDYTNYPDRDWDYNCFWWDGSSKFNFLGNVYSFSGWQNITGEDINSFVYANTFVSGGDDLHLVSDSDCINAGIPVGLLEDLDGDPIIGNPDIGYDEYTN